jgi:DNA-binding response OmpR family regulator
MALLIQLQAFGFEVVACPDAYLALAQARIFQPDVVLLDIRMPAGDGFSVVERMRKIPELGNVQVIYMTGEKSEELDSKAKRMGARGVIHKPIRLSELMAMIDSVMGVESESMDNEMKKFFSEVREEI